MTITYPPALDPYPWATRHYEPWSPGEEIRLAEMVEAGTTLLDMARQLNRRPGSIQTRMRLRSLRWCSGYTIARVAELLGWDFHVVRQWAKQRFIRFHRTKIRVGRGWLSLTDHEALCQFLAEESCWHLWEPERITDSALREWATEIRRGIRFLTTGEAGKILGITHYAVNRAIREGRIRAVRLGVEKWLIRSDWLTLPDRKRFLRGKAFSESELAHIREWWGRKPAAAIAREIGRSSDSGVSNAARRMGMFGLGQGYWKRLAPSGREEV